MKEGLPTAEKSSFEEQFADRFRVKTANGETEGVDIDPGGSKETPVVFAPAWGCDLQTYEPALKELASQERRVISFNQARKGEELDPEIKKKFEELENENPETLRRALSILDVMRERGVDQADLIGHSEGGLDAIVAATLHPEKIKNLVLLAPAGLIGKDNLFRLLMGFAGQNKRAPTLKAQEGWPEIAKDETEKKVGAAAMASSQKYVAGNPMRSIKEVLEIKNARAEEMLSYLHDKGVGVVVMSGVDDPVFPQERINRMVDSHMVDGFLAVRGGHGPYGEHPDRYMKAVEHMLTALEAKEKKED